ncbi:F-box protein At3g07870-like [Lycium barbarum]|uniref:F-box protein At3g07870-like n=1 Tax=Lycium barbarum TaxID=112863 RepID=UPI00293E22CB|nr:F-box protein At3g07870-like [Lycium barbarum]
MASTPLLLFRHMSTKTKPKKQERYSIYLDDPSKTQLEDPPLVKEVKFPLNTTTGIHFRVVGYCNGLFCLSDDLFGYTDTIILWNPTIRKTLSLPKPCIVISSPKMYFCLGFGFDLKTQDFKVGRIAYLQGTNAEVEVYSLSTGVWKTVNSKGINGKLVKYFYTTTYLNGAIHWVSYRKKKNGKFTNSLLVFDLSDETFSEMGLPRWLVHVSPSVLSVSLCGDRISVFQYRKSCEVTLESCVVSVMNQYGNKKSWRKIYTAMFKSEFEYSFAFVVSSEDNYWNPLRNFGGVLFYDPEKKEFKDGEKDPFFLSSYIESLVLLDRSSGSIADSSNSREPTGVKPQ